MISVKFHLLEETGHNLFYHTFTPSVVVTAIGEEQSFFSGHAYSHHQSLYVFVFGFGILFFVTFMPIMANP